MRPVHSLLLLLLLLSLGAAAWWLVRGGTRPPAFAPAVPESALPEVARAVEDVQLRAPEGGSGQEPSPQRTSAEVLPEPAEPAALSARAPSPVRSRVRGLVLDERGAPVAGARVLSSSGSMVLMDGMPLDSRGMQGLPGLKHDVKTDGEGRFELSGLPPGPLRLAVRAPGFAPYDDNGLSVPAEPDHELEPLRLAAGVFVEGRVVDAAGRGVAGAEVERKASTASSLAGSAAIPMATTGADGRFLLDQLASGTIHLQARHEAHPTAAAVVSTSRPGERVRDLRIELPDGAWIRGRVTGAPPGELEMLQVTAAPEGSRRRMFTSGAEQRGVPLQADGSFAIGGLLPDKAYDLALQRTRRPGAAREVMTFLGGGGLSEPVRATAGEAGVELRWQPECTLVARVVDASTGRPVESLQVEAGVAWPMPLIDPESGKPQVSFPDGWVRFPGLRAPSVQARAQLRIAASGYELFQREGIALVPGEETDLGEIALQPSALVRVQVLDGATGTPLAGARVALQLEPQGNARTMRRGMRVSIGAGDDDVSIQDDSRRTARSDDEGWAALSSFEGQPCLVEVSHPSFAPYRSASFVAASGRHTEHTARLTQGGSVEVRLTRRDGAPVAGGRVEHRPPGQEGLLHLGLGRDEGGRGVTDRNGLAAFDRLTPGLHRFRPAQAGGAAMVSMGGERMAMFAGAPSGARDEGWTEVEVVDGGDTRITLEVPMESTLAGRVREGGVPLPGAKLSLTPVAQSEELRFLGSMGGGPSATSDGEGRYELERVRQGRYVLSVQHASRMMTETFEVEVGEGEQRFDVSLSVAIVEGRVLDEQGKPVAGARVWAAKAAAAGRSQPRMVTRVITMGSDGGGAFSLGEEAVAARVTTDERGRFSLRGVQPDVELEVLAEASSFRPVRSERFRMAPDEVRRGIDLEARPGGKVEVVIDRGSFEGQLAMLAVARRQGAEGSAADPRTIVVGPEGRGTLDGLAPGPWTVRVERLGPGSSPIPEQTVEVQAGKTAQATFTLP